MTPVAPKTDTDVTANKKPDRREKRDRRDDRQDKSPYMERVVFINRVAKVVQGGRRFSFTALVVVGDGNGTLGIGYGKAKEVPQAIAKAIEEAKKSFFKVPRIQGTIPHPVQGDGGASRVFIRPASEGTGVIAGGAARAVLELAGVHNVLSKSIGSSSPLNVARATMHGLKKLRTFQEIAEARGISMSQLLHLQAAAN